MRDESPSTTQAPGGLRRLVPRLVELWWWVPFVVLQAVATPAGADLPYFEPIELNEPWAFRPGDDLRWAEPDFDDSSWPRATVPGSWGSQGFGQVEVGWYRLTVEPIPKELAGPEGHLGLRLGPIISHARIFAGGRELGHSGPAATGSPTHYDQHTIVPVPPGAVRDGRLVLAIRVARHAAFGPQFGGILRIAPELGRLDDLARRESRQDAPGLAAAAACAFLGLVAALFSRGRRPAEGRWLGCMLITVAMITWLNSQWRFVWWDDFVTLKKAEVAFRFLLPVLWMQWIVGLGDRLWTRKRRLAARLYQVVFLVWGFIVVLAPGLELSILTARGWFWAALPMLAISVPVFARTSPGKDHALGLRIGAAAAWIALVIDSHSGLTGLLRPLWLPFGFLALGLAWSAGRELRFEAMGRRLVELKGRFENRVEERTRELSGALERAESLSQSRIELFASLSHEIRTPMMGILGVGNLLLKRDLGPQERGYARTIRSSALALLGVLNDILDFSKIEAGHLSLQPEVFEVREAVAGVVELLRPKAQEKRIDLLSHVWPEAPQWVLGDPWRLRQVLINLVGNAIKFTQDGKVVLEVLPARHAAGSKQVVLRFAVVDTGVGVDPDELPRLFDAFTQSGSGPQQLVGTGLGLAISRRIVESMNGHIGADSQIGEGSNFWFEIPLTVAEEPTSKTTLSGSLRTLCEGRVLLVEDNEVNRMVIIGQLESLGVGVDVVNNGREALGAIERSSYDLVLMDCQMPDIDGYEATRLIRGKETSDRLPIVAITAHAFEGERERCLQAGMDDYLVKPFEEEQLAVVLDRWMRSGETAAARSPGTA